MVLNHEGLFSEKHLYTGLQKSELTVPSLGPYQIRGLQNHSHTDLNKLDAGAI